MKMLCMCVYSSFVCTYLMNINIVHTIVHIHITSNIITSAVIWFEYQFTIDKVQAVSYRFLLNETILHALGQLLALLIIY